MIYCSAFISSIFHFTDLFLIHMIPWTKSMKPCSSLCICVKGHNQTSLHDNLGFHHVQKRGLSWGEHASSFNSISLLLYNHGIQIVNQSISWFLHLFGNGSLVSYTEQNLTVWSGCFLHYRSKIRAIILYAHPTKHLWIQITIPNI